MRPVETYKGASYTVCVVRVEISYQRKANGNSEQRYFNYDSVFYKKKKSTVYGTLCLAKSEICFATVGLLNSHYQSQKKKRFAVSST